jgi:hypothetical protein
VAGLLKYPALALLAASHCVPLRADSLVWDRTRASLVVQPEQGQVSTEFAFRNAGPRDVALTRILTSCGCVAATADRTAYGPGQSGRIHAVFETGAQTGTKQKTITIATDEPGAQPAVLLLDIRILQYVRVDPLQFAWKPGENPQQSILCSSDSDREITLSRVTCSLSDITASSETLESGRRYVIHLRSPSRPNPATARIQLEFAVAGVGMRTIDVYAYFP